MGSAFSEAEQAAQRLGLVHEVFAAASEPFLREQAPEPPGLAIDLGCGPGPCSALLAEVTRARRVVGLDASAPLIQLAQRFVSEQLEFRVHDVTVVPFPVGPADLLYGRLLLSYLSDSAQVLARWGTQLRMGGRLLIEEVESIESDHPCFGAYLDLVARAVTHEGNPLYPGPELERLGPVPGLVKRSSLVRRLEVQNAQAAQMFGSNLPSWKTHSFVQAHFPAGTIAEIEENLRKLATQRTSRRDTQWGIRQLVFERA